MPHAVPSITAMALGMSSPFQVLRENVSQLAHNVVNWVAPSRTPLTQSRTLRPEEIGIQIHYHGVHHHRSSSSHHETDSGRSIGSENPDRPPNFAEKAEVSLAAGFLSHGVAMPSDRGFNDSFMKHLGDITKKKPQNFWQKLWSCRSIMGWSAFAHSLELPIADALHENCGFSEEASDLITGFLHETVEGIGYRRVFIETYNVKNPRWAFWFSGVASALSESPSLHGSRKKYTSSIPLRILNGSIACGLVDGATTMLRIHQRSRFNNTPMPFKEIFAFMRNNPQQYLELCLWRFAAGSTRGFIFNLYRIVLLETAARAERQ